MNDSFLTSVELGLMTQTQHRFVLERTCEQLLKAGIDPNNYWVEYQECGQTKKRLHLPKRECLLAIKDDWYSEKAKRVVLDLWDVWDREDA